MSDSTHFDIIIVGSGAGGATLGAGLTGHRVNRAPG